MHGSHVQDKKVQPLRRLDFFVGCYMAFRLLHSSHPAPAIRIVPRTVKLVVPGPPVEGSS